MSAEAAAEAYAFELFRGAQENYEARLDGLVCSTSKNYIGHLEVAAPPPWPPPGEEEASTVPATAAAEKALEEEQNAVPPPPPPPPGG